MRVNPYSSQLLELTIDLLNRPPIDVLDLEKRWIATGMPIENPSRANDLALITGYLSDWQLLIASEQESARVAVLNTMLRQYGGPPSVTNHDGTGWHMHYRPDTASLAEALAAATTVAIAEHLTAHGVHRLGRCALDECGNAFVDLSRPGRQRYCSQPCANRDAVRRHRHRARGAHAR